MTCFDMRKVELNLQTGVSGDWELRIGNLLLLPLNEAVAFEYFFFCDGLHLL